MINTVTLLGRLVADPELRHTQNDNAVTSFTLAVDAGWGDHKRTDFIDVIAWRQTAEFVCNYFSKGQMMAVTGSIQTRNYEDKNGNKRKAFEVVAREVSFCGSKSEGQSKAESKSETPPPRPAEFQEPVYEESDQESWIGIDNDDLPF